MRLIARGSGQSTTAHRDVQRGHCRGCWIRRQLNEAQISSTLGGPEPLEVLLARGACIASAAARVDRRGLPALCRRRAAGRKPRHGSRRNFPLPERARESLRAVVALSQLNRSVESRQDKRPMMSDLREIERLNRMRLILFLYLARKLQPGDPEQFAEIIVAKQRTALPHP